MGPQKPHTHISGLFPAWVLTTTGNLCTHLPDFISPLGTCILLHSLLWLGKVIGLGYHLEEAVWHLPQGTGGYQFSSVTQSCLTLCKPMNCSMPGFPVHHQLPEFTQTHVRWVGNAIQLSHPLSSPSPPAFNLSQYQGLFQGVSSSHQMAKVVEFQLQHQSFQWIFRTDFL